jgi:hypothetical protein
MAKKSRHPTKQRGTSDTTSVGYPTGELDAWSYLEEAVVENLGFV